MQLSKSMYCNSCTASMSPFLYRLSTCIFNSQCWSRCQDRSSCWAWRGTVAHGWAQGMQLFWWTVHQCTISLSIASFRVLVHSCWERGQVWRSWWNCWRRASQALQPCKVCNLCKPPVFLASRASYIILKSQVMLSPMRPKLSTRETICCMLEPAV